MRRAERAPSTCSSGARAQWKQGETLANGVAVVLRLVFEENVIAIRRERNEVQAGIGDQARRWLAVLRITHPASRSDGENAMTCGPSASSSSHTPGSAIGSATELIGVASQASRSVTPHASCISIRRLK